MKASILDLRRKMREVLSALDRNEAVTILYRGKEKAVLKPIAGPTATADAANHPAFGMWADRRDLEDVRATVSRLRQGRVHGI